MGRKWINRLRASRDRIRISYSRSRYDRLLPEVDSIEGLHRVVFIRWDAKWGDSVVFSFVPKALKAFDPAISVEVVTTPEMAPLFRDTFAVDMVHETVRKPGKESMRALAEKIGEVDLVVFFSHLIKHRDIYLLSQLRTRHIASLDDSVGLVDVKLGEATRGRHMVDKYLRLLEKCGITGVATDYVVPRSDDAEARVSQCREWRRPMIAFNAYSKGRARSLTPETSARLIELIRERLPEHEVCVLSAPGKQAEVERLCAQFDDGGVVYLPETRAIHDNIALIARSDGLVSGITATVHIADGMGVPSFVLFPYDPDDRDDWHSRHPDSVNLLSKPGDPQDVNRLDWEQVEIELDEFCASISREDINRAAEHSR